jgi:hypothetical protein
LPAGAPVPLVGSGRPLLRCIDKFRISQGPKSRNAASCHRLRAPGSSASWGERELWCKPACGQQSVGQQSVMACAPHGRRNCHRQLPDLPLGLGLLDLARLQRRHRADRVLRLLLDPAMVRRWHADPFGFLRPWGEVPALFGSAPPSTPPSTGTGVVTFLMG